MFENMQVPLNFGWGGGGGGGLFSGGGSSSSFGGFSGRSRSADRRSGFDRRSLDRPGSIDRRTGPADRRSTSLFGMFVTSGSASADERAAASGIGVLGALVFLGAAGMLAIVFGPPSIDQSRRSSDASQSRTAPPPATTAPATPPVQSTALQSAGEPLDIRSEVQKRSEVEGLIDPVSGVRMPTPEEYRQCAKSFAACEPWMYLSTAMLRETTYIDSFGVPHTVLVSPILAKRYKTSIIHDFREHIRRPVQGDSTRPIVLYQRFDKVGKRTRITHYITRVLQSDLAPQPHTLPIAWVSDPGRPNTQYRSRPSAPPLGY